jgi:hypothetical protein
MVPALRDAETWKEAAFHTPLRPHYYFSMLPLMPGGKEMKAKLDSAVALAAEKFEYRWAAD